MLTVCSQPSLVETEFERKDSQRRFWKWFNSPAVMLELGINMHGKIHAFWDTSLQETENNWAADKTADIPTFDVRTANASEQMNHSTKNGSMTVNPCQKNRLISKHCDEQIKPLAGGKVQKGLQDFHQ